MLVQGYFMPHPLRASGAHTLKLACEAGPRGRKESMK
jgi:hypothetical protein